MSMIGNQLLPILIMIIIGILIEKNGLLGEAGSRVINTFAYYIGMPLLLFSSIATHFIELERYQSYSLAFVLATLLLYSATVFYYRLVRKNKPNVAVLKGIGSSLPNSGFIGIPVATALFGDTGLIVASLTTLLTLIPLSAAILALETHNKKAGATLKQVMMVIIKNPLLLATVLGISVSRYHISLPVFILHTCEIIGNTAIPCALFGIGQMLVIFKVKRVSDIYLPAFIKVVIHPLVTFCFLYWFAVDQQLIIIGVMMAALPTAVVQSILAYQYQVFEAESSGLILFSTLVSFFTLPLLLYIGLQHEI